MRDFTCLLVIRKSFKEGIFVKTVTNGTADVTATATAQGITIPMKRVFQNELKLVK